MPNFIDIVINPSENDPEKRYIEIEEIDITEPQPLSMAQHSEKILADIQSASEWTSKPKYMNKGTINGEAYYYMSTTPPEDKTDERINRD